MDDLLKSGFSFQESLIFLQKLYHCNVLRHPLAMMLATLSKGKPLHEAFKKAGFQPMIVSKIALCEAHGDLEGSLSLMHQQLSSEHQRLVQLRRLLQYPLLLLVMLSFLMLLLKFVLFPKLTSLTPMYEKTWEFYIIMYFPQLIGVTLLILGCVWFMLYRYWKTLSPIHRELFCLKFPFLRLWCRYHRTCYFCEAFGQLLALGLETQHILKVLQEDGQVPWIQAVSAHLEHSLTQGIAVGKSVESFPFFFEGLAYFIQEGEMKGKLADELLMYNQELWKAWLEKLERWLQWVQPIIFIFIGLMVICMYAAILLPMYHLY